MLARHRAHESGLEEQPYTDGVITGWGTVDGRKVFVSAKTSPSLEVHSARCLEKIHKVMDLALSPVLNDRSERRSGCPNSRGVVSLASYGGIFRRNVMSSGVVPQISVILGPCAGGAVYSPAMTDFIFMVANHHTCSSPDQMW